MSEYTVNRCLARARQWLEPVDAYALLAHVLDCSKEHLIAWPDKVVTKETFDRFEALVMQRENEVPLAYLVGHKEFWSMHFKVTTDVLIPRPDTEILVEIALQHLPQGARVLELATGTGIIACVLAHERPDITVLATDISEKALEVAAWNTQYHHLNQITLLQSDWFASIPSFQYDMIVANPPYLDEADPHLFGDIRFEPHGALVAPEHGLASLFTIIQQSKKYLKPQGYLMLEHGYTQGSAVAQYMEHCGYQHITAVHDLSGHERVTYAAL